MTREDGFTLMEVLVALTVASAIGVVILTGLNVAEQRRVQSHDRDEAFEFALQQVETRRLAPHRTGEWNGRTADFGWQVVEIALLEDPRQQAALDRIEVMVRDEEGELLASLSRSALRRYERAE